jgi:hypothetical protein
MTTLKPRPTDLPRREPGAASYDACAFVDFLRSSGDGQAARLQAFCRCPTGPDKDRPGCSDRSPLCLVAEVAEASPIALRRRPHPNGVNRRRVQGSFGQQRDESDLGPRTKAQRDALP